MKAMSRRKLIEQAGGAVSWLSVVGIGSAERQTTVPAAPDKSRLKVIVAGGHPGDPEYGCGGTIARYAERGADIVLLYLNRGQGGIPDKSPNEAMAIRSAEASKACRLLNARPLFAGQIDGRSVVDTAHYDQFCSLIQTEKPDVLFTQWPIDNHPDHRATSMLCYEAWLRMNKSFGFYYYEVSNGEDTVMFSPNEYVDITSVETRKRDACHAHASQSPDRFYALQSQIARFRGIESGFSSAEAFVRHIQSPVGQLPHLSGEKPNSRQPHTGLPAEKPGR
jgi:LmbE family N-acetylglucosaminyl deacetylase